MATYKLVNADQLDSDLTAVGNAIRSKGGTSAGLSFPAGMVSAIGAISTGVELNFDVVGGTSQPSNPKENTIWVNTSKTITDWVFSATQPTAASGRVWISTATSSTVKFNALKKNSIMVYPLSAKQYVSGAWVDKAARNYHGGAWVTWWSGELYDSGNEYTAFTDGWKATTFAGSTKVTKDTTSMTIKTDYGDDALYCSKKIDLTNFSQFVVTGKSFRNNGSAERRAGNTKICIWSAIGSSASSNRAAYTDYPAEDYDGELKLNVANLTGEYYVGVFAGRYYSVTVRKVKLS